MLKLKSAYSYIKTRLPNVKKYILCIYSLKLVFMGISLVSPFLYQILIDKGFTQRSDNIVLLIIAGNILVFFTESLFSFVEMRLGIKYNNKLKLNISTSILNKFVKTPYYKYENYDVGEAKKLINDESNIFSSYIQSQIIDKSYNLIMLFSATICMAVYNIWLAIFAWLMIPASFFLTKIFAKKSNELNEKWRTDWIDYESWLINNLNAWKEVKINNYSSQLLKIFIRKWKNLCILFFKRQMLFIANYSLNDFKDTFIVKMNIYFLGAVFIMQGNLSVGALLAFMLYYEKTISSVNGINAAKMSLSEMQPAINRIMEIDEPQKSCEQVANNSFDIKYEKVSFSYSSSAEYTFSDISLNIPYGSNVFLQGSSGIGKSTLIKLLLGLYEPIEGKVTIGNLLASEIAQCDNDNTIGAVMQDSFMFSLNIIDNFKLVNPIITDDEIVKACKKAHIDDFINLLPDRYDTLLHENSNNISGGQKQRLSLAMVIAQNPFIVIFDEVTSALDMETESAIREVIRNEFKGKTVINISHTYDNIDAFDLFVNITNDGVFVTQRNG